MYIKVLTRAWRERDEARNNLDRNISSWRAFTKGIKHRFLILDINRLNTSRGKWVNESFSYIGWDLSSNINLVVAIAFLTYSDARSYIESHVWTEDSYLFYRPKKKNPNLSHCPEKRAILV